MDDYQIAVKKFDIKLIEFDADEKIICEIRKHFFGYILIYLTGTFIAGIVLFAGILASLWLEVNPVNTSSPSGAIGTVVLAAGTFISITVTVLTLVYGYIFGNNVVLVTTEKVSQILYKSLFDRKVSQLNISDVQDVTVNQVGIFARAFNYGTLVIETAGEQQNYTFTYSPRPHECAKLIISARETNVKFFGN